MKIRLNAMALLLLILFTMTVTAVSEVLAEQQQNPATVVTLVPAEYLLGVGDLIEVQTWKEPDLSRTMRVRSDGRISLPLIGDIEAVGKTPRALALQIEELYRKSLSEPSVTIILNQSNQHYYVIGQVQHPGEFALDSDLTVLQALARSGGFLQWAKTSNIAVIRREGGGEKHLSFDYDAMIKKETLTQHLLLAPGDTIVVP